MKTLPPYLRSGLTFFPLVLLMLLQPGCHRPGDSPETTQTEPPPQPSSSPPSSELVVFTYPEYLAPEALRQFESQTGIAVRYEVFESVDELRGKLESAPSHYDVVIADEGTSMDLLHLQLIQPFHRKKLPDLERLDSRFASPRSAEENPVFVPYLWGSTIAAYRTDKLDLGPEDESWKLFWDPRVRGRAVLSSESSEILPVGLATLGYPLHSRKTEHHHEAVDHLRDAILENGVDIGDSWTNLERLTSGEVWLSHCYSGDAASFAAQDDRIGYFMPKEGAELWVDGFMLTRDGNYTDAAHAFVAFMLQPEVAVASSNYTWYLTPNSAALPELDPELLADEVLNPSEAMLERCSLVPTLDDRVWMRQLQYGMRKIQKALEERERKQSPPADSTLLSVDRVE